MSSGNSDVFTEAVKVEKLDSHTYKVNLVQDFCIGAVPNGGYTSSCILAVARAHLQTRQPDTLTAQLTFPGRTTPGPAIVTVEDIKLGRQLSTLHLSLWQQPDSKPLLPHHPWLDHSVARRAVLAYATQTSLASFADAPSLPTHWESIAPNTSLPQPMPDFAALKKKTTTTAATASDDGGFWQRGRPPPGPKGNFRSAHFWTFFLPRGDLDRFPTPGSVDFWMCRADGRRIPPAALPYVADAFPYEIHQYFAAPELRKMLLAPRPQGQKLAEAAQKVPVRSETRSGLWFPTVMLNLELKKALPAEGAEWLALRVTSRKIKDGRMDIDVLIRDVEGDIVALSQQTALILSMERNTAKRKESKASL